MRGRICEDWKICYLFCIIKELSFFKTQTKNLERHSEFIECVKLWKVDKREFRWGSKCIEDLNCSSHLIIKRIWLKFLGEFEKLFLRESNVYFFDKVSRIPAFDEQSNERIEASIGLHLRGNILSRVFYRDVRQFSFSFAAEFTDDAP